MTFRIESTNHRGHRLRWTLAFVDLVKSLDPDVVLLAESLDAMEAESDSLGKEIDGFTAALELHDSIVARVIIHALVEERIARLLTLTSDITLTIQHLYSKLAWIYLANDGSFPRLSNKTLKELTIT